MGTDKLGRDVLSRIMHGAKCALAISLVGIVLGAVVGTFLGLVAGYYRGWLEALIMRPEAVSNPAFSQVNGLSKHFSLTSGIFGRRSSVVKAVDDVSFSVEHGQTLALVGRPDSSFQLDVLCLQPCILIRHSCQISPLDNSY